LLIMCTAFACPWCLSQPVSWDEALRGLNGIIVLVSLASATGKAEDIRACGLDDTTLKTAAEFVLQQSKLKLQEASAAQASFAIIVWVIPNRMGERLTACSLVVETSVNTRINAATAWGTVKNVGFTVWRSYQMVTGPVDRLAAEASNAVTDNAKSFVVAWAKQN
jgi:hypothetical protein